MTPLDTIGYDLSPHVTVPGTHRCQVGWEAIAAELASACDPTRTRLTIDCYTGVLAADVGAQLGERLPVDLVIDASRALKTPAAIEDLVAPFEGGDDPLFGLRNNLRLPDFFDPARIAALQKEIAACPGRVLIYGIGATLIDPGSIVVLADMARWEEQKRHRRGEVANIGGANLGAKPSLIYKRAYFTEWRAYDLHKQALMDHCHYLLDTCTHETPKLISGAAFRAGLAAAARQPIRVVPFFDPAPWGGQWMRRNCGLDGEEANYGWCFDCVPEENSLLLRVDGQNIEVPSIDLVLRHPVELLGDRVHARFGAEFPIRFDFLDTIEGGHLSFQVHPLTEYIQNEFGMHYTQDESYYLLDATDEACVYLGVKTGVQPEDMRRDLEAAQRGEIDFPAEDYANCWPAKKHDHFLIPAGTVHCSGHGSMVLEISATPYIFTFKMWDWGRLGLDGKPRPINIDRGLANICWERDTEFTRRHLVNAIEPLGVGEGWRAERTGLHEREFIDTVRQWFTGTVHHEREDTVDVLNLIEGAEALIESPEGAFAPFLVHYAETVIVPAAAGAYTIRPHGAALGSEIATIRARVRG